VLWFLGYDRHQNNTIPSNIRNHQLLDALYLDMPSDTDSDCDYDEDLSHIESIECATFSECCDWIFTFMMPIASINNRSSYTIVHLRLNGHLCNMVPVSFDIIQNNTIPSNIRNHQLLDALYLDMPSDTDSDCDYDEEFTEE
jgi:hypothetical protein